MILRPLLPFLLGAVLLPSLAPHLADAAPGKPKKAATAKGGGEGRRHLEAGTRAFKAGAYARARTELGQAYRLAPAPSTLHMNAECNFKLNDYGAAYDAYAKVAANGAAKKGDQADAQRMMGVLEKLTGEVVIESSGPPADVSIDGRAVGKTPFDKAIRLGAGTHQIHTSVNGTSAGDTPVTVKAEEKVAVKLEGATAAPEGGEDSLAISSVKGKISIEVNPSGGAILIDGEEMGTGKYEGELPEGPHKVTIVLAGFKNETREVIVSGGKPASESIALEAEEAEPAAEKAPVAKSLAGLYGSVAAFGVLPISGTVRIPADNNGNGTASPQLGGGLSIRLGHSFGVLGIEGAVAFLGETHQERHAIPGETDPESADFQAGNVQRTDSIGITSLGAFVGAGPRVTTGGSSTRFTFGATPGASLRRFSVHREVGGGAVDSYKTSVVATSFAVVADASVLLGSTPGLKISLGLVAWADFAGHTATPSGDPRTVTVPSGGHTVNVALPTPTYTMTNGAEIFVGPQLGVRFGH